METLCPCPFLGGYLLSLLQPLRVPSSSFVPLRGYLFSFVSGKVKAFGQGFFHSTHGNREPHAGKTPSTAGVATDGGIPAFLGSGPIHPRLRRHPAHSRKTLSGLSRLPVTPERPGPGEPPGCTPGRRLERARRHPGKEPGESVDSLPDRSQATSDAHERQSAKRPRDCLDSRVDRSTAATFGSRKSGARYGPGGG